MFGVWLHPPESGACRLRFLVPPPRGMGQSIWETTYSPTGKGEPFALPSRPPGTAGVSAWSFTSAPPFSSRLWL